jgi:hypothetical protein
MLYFPSFDLVPADQYGAAIEAETAESETSFAQGEAVIENLQDCVEEAGVAYISESKDNSQSYSVIFCGFVEFDGDKLS